MKAPVKACALRPKKQKHLLNLEMAAACRRLVTRHSPSRALSLAVWRLGGGAWLLGRGRGPHRDWGRPTAGRRTRRPGDVPDDGGVRTRLAWPPGDALTPDGLTVVDGITAGGQRAARLRRCGLRAGGKGVRRALRRLPGSGAPRPRQQGATSGVRRRRLGRGRRGRDAGSGRMEWGWPDGSAHR
jgi:hypothetical protein